MSHASRNVLRINSCEGLTSRKWLNCSFAQDIWQERCVENRFPQWERSGWCIVTSTVQCKHSQLEGQSISSRLLMITLGAALYTSWNTSQKYSTNLRNLKSQPTNHVGRAIRTLRTGNGDKYSSIELKNYLKEKGIRHELTVPRSSQHKSVSERMNRTLVDSARSMQDYRETAFSRRR